LNVVSGSGPYNELLTIPYIPGSDNYQVTINGNGNTITYLTDAGDAVVRFDSAQNVVVDSLNIVVDNAATTGWGVHLYNNSVGNTISNSNISLPLTSTSNTLAGIVASASNASETTNGITASNTTIIYNTIRGGYYGIRINGDSAV